MVEEEEGEEGGGEEEQRREVEGEVVKVETGWGED